MKKQKIIIFFPVGIGDSLMFTPIISYLKSKSSIMDNYEIDALVMNPATEEILKNNNTNFFANIHFINFLKQPILSSLKEVFRLRKNNYNKSILIFPANLYKYQIIHFLLGAKKRYSHTYLLNSSLDLYWLSNIRIDEDRSLHSTEENYKLIEKVFNILDRDNTKDKNDKNNEMSIKLNDDSFKFADRYLKKLETDSDNDIQYIGIHTGSDTFKNLIHKRWNKEYFIDLIQLIKDKYTNPLHFLLFGISDEIEVNEYIEEKLIAKDLKIKITVVKNTSFLESAALISKCSFFISNDSGLMHTAAALDIPVLSIFGPTNENYTKPLTGNHIVSIIKNCNCRPCFEYSKFSLICNETKQYRCMVDLVPKIVFEDFNKLYNQVLNNNSSN